MTLNSTFASTNLPERLAARLAAPLPGIAAWNVAAPELSYGRHAGPAPSSAREAAILVLFYLHQGQWHLPLMLRPDTMVAHAGQVSFPGGVMEIGESPEACALREFSEELGPLPTDVTLLGRLTPVYIYGSNFRVIPCVAATRQSLAFSPNPEEVAEILEVPISLIVDPAAQADHRRHRFGVSYHAPHVATHGQKIWGATYLMLAELSQVIASGMAPPAELDWRTPTR